MCDLLISRAIRFDPRNAELCMKRLCLASRESMATAHATLPAAPALFAGGRRLLLSREHARSFAGITRFSPRPIPIGSSPPATRLTVRLARTESGGVTLGFRSPDFELPEPLTNKLWKLEDFESNPALLVMFICNHCPFVKHLKKDIVKLANFYMQKDLAIEAISSNSVETHPQDGPKFMAEEASLFKYPFPYLYDESQEVAHAFGAVCTPEFFLFRKNGRRPFELFYHGQFDDSRPGNSIPVTGRDLSLAIDCILSSQQLAAPQKPSVGCSIKWHPGK